MFVKISFMFSHRRVEHGVSFAEVLPLVHVHLVMRAEIFHIIDVEFVEMGREARAFLEDGVEALAHDAVEGAVLQVDVDVAEVNTMRGRLTYLETSVSTTGTWTGTVTYRSYLGRNATSDFDIEGNARYIWSVIFREDELQESTWKRETDLSFTTYEKEFLLSPASATLEVGYTRTYRAFIRTWAVVNGARTTYTDSVLQNTDLMWRRRPGDVPYKPIETGEATAQITVAEWELGLNLGTITI